jgi:RNA polymerase sigma factor (sigma-70 family)
VRHFPERFLFPEPGTYTITAEVFPGGDIQTPTDSQSIPVDHADAAVSFHAHRGRFVHNLRIARVYIAAQSPHLRIDAMPDDALLLSRYAQHRNADAFTALVHRYAGLVYAAALRMTGNPHDAEDLAQECFLQLARHAGAITGSLPAWLHATAVNRARNARRDAATRRRHEEQAMAQPSTPAEPSWEDLAPHVDAAIAALPEELRLPLIRHYLQGQSQSEIAAEMQVNQATISRRLTAAIEDLRAQLASTANLSIAPLVLTGLLSHLAPMGVPASLVAGLTKMALAGPAPSAHATTAFLTAHAKFFALAALLALAAVVTFTLRSHTKQESATMPAITSTTGPSSVRHANNRVWIDGVPRLQWGKSGDNTFTGAFHASLTSMDEKVSYEELMVNSGLAFRLRRGRSVDGLSWNGSAPIGELSDVDHSASTGWPLRWDGAFSKHHAQGIQEIVASIDAGRPVLGYVNRTEWDMGLVYGYQDGGKTLLVQDYYFKGDEPNIVPATDVHDLVAFFDTKASPVTPRDALLQGLKKAVAFWNMGTIDVQQIKTWEAKGQNLFYYGPHAYRQWREDLTAAGDLPADKLPGLRHHNMWIGCSLNDGRRAAAKALPAMVPLLQQEAARKEFQAAADTYAQLADVCGKRLVPCLAMDVAKFTPELRQAAIEALREVERLDTQAIDHLTNALGLGQAAGPQRAVGSLDLASPDGFGFIRLGQPTAPYQYRDLDGSEHTFHAAATDVFVSVELVRQHHLKQGDMLECTTRPPVGNERFPAAVEIDLVPPKR